MKKKKQFSHAISIKQVHNMCKLTKIHLKKKTEFHDNPNYIPICVRYPNKILTNIRNINPLRLLAHKLNLSFTPPLYVRAIIYFWYKTEW